MQHVFSTVHWALGGYAMGLHEVELSTERSTAIWAGWNRSSEAGLRYALDQCRRRRSI